MTVLERKNHLHQLIVETNDAIVLEKVELFFEQLLSNTALDWSDKINKEEQKAIEIGLSEAKVGKLIPHEEVKAKAVRMF